MLTLLVVWALLVVLLLVFGIGRPREGGALTLAYFFGLSLIHVPGVLPFVFSGSVPFLVDAQGLTDPEATRVGFQMTVLGMAAFVVGASVACVVDRRHAAAGRLLQRRRAQTLNALGWREISVGTVGYFLLLPLSHSVPSLTSLLSPLGVLLIVGLWLVLYGAVQTGDTSRIWSTVLLLPLLPLATLATGGYIGYGVAWVLSVLAFLFVLARGRLWFYLATPLAVYLGLSLFVSYMGVRSNIRDVVWNAQSSFADRIERISTIFTDFQLLDMGSSAHISALDGRLNQNAIVGLAIGHIENGWAGFAYGATVPVWALIPRAVWPEKPDVGGGRDVVSQFTGLEYGPETSVGAGQVFEFYVNFGTVGVVIGFVLLGFGLMWLDREIMRALAADDGRGVLLRAMPGLVLLQPGGNLLEIVVAAVAAVALSHVVVHISAFGFLRAVRPRRQAG